MDLLIENIRRRCNITDEEAEIILSKVEKRTFKRKEKFLEPGEVSNRAVFVLEGCMRSYSIDAQGNEHVLQFAPQSWWVTDMYSFISSKPSVLHVDAIVETKAYTLTRANQVALFDLVPSVERFFRILTENALVANQQRLLDGMSLTAKQRYLNFCNIYPGLIYDLPQKQVASFIGVTPEFLSKLKKEILLEK